VRPGGQYMQPIENTYRGDVTVENQSKHRIKIIILNKGMD